METGKRLIGKVAIVSGGASGIGAETVRVFAAHGASVVACDVNEALGQSVVDGICQDGGEAMFRTLDVSSEQQWAALVAEVEESHGRLDVLTNIAGISGRDPSQNIQPTLTAGGVLEDQSLEKWNQVMEVNATGTYLGTKAVIAPMRRSGGGSIINISSICGLVGSFGNPAYHASKGAVRLFSKAVAIQYAADGIRANSIHPGFVDTPMTEPGHANPEVAKMRLEATPLGRFGTPRDVAMGCLYLASDEASWVTGSELVIDGGMTAN
ncbi:MAG: glucose 1-dehydrogenase [Alphaproteobacteria bacterium]|nr:glucose 1-dehydrogenase [Alphaproteobacteria bacterium]MDP6813306.1 glucose 1-dehydrogenase [Alphaproteobacteria bacterium]